MTIDKEVSNGMGDGAGAAVSQVTLPAEVSISTVAAVRPSLDAVLDDTCMHVAVDAGAVSHVDTAGLQLIAAFIAAASDVGVEAEVVAASDLFRRACEESGWLTLVEGRRAVAKAGAGVTEPAGDPT